MADTLSLFDTFPHAARTTDPETSHEAAQMPGRVTLRLRCLEALAARPDGLTDFELADLVGAQQTSAGKRRGELVALGLVEATEERRLTPSGARAIVWKITDHYRQENL